MSLAVEELAVRFGGVAALVDVSFEVEPERITSLIGPNGAGKTTAFNVITGFLRPARGRVLYEGKALTGLRPFQVAERGIVRTFQKTNLFHRVSVLDNVMIGLHLRGRMGFLSILLGDRRVREEETALRGVAEEILAFVGLAHRRDEVASALPYGEQRLLELAVGLAARPRLLLLDEPVSGMNPAEKTTVMGLIRRIREQGVTILLVEHDMRLVMGISDQVIVLHHGRVIAQGPPGEIQSHPEVIRAYLGGR
ncbi:MAG: ABC transporter ATP-binding protein [Candidatus Rokubacteria bacterium]|nr:ABC transporter ATP-binding protein [Candidatus Rokubacteria bacterium]